MLGPRCYPYNDLRSTKDQGVIFSRSPSVRLLIQVDLCDHNAIKHDVEDSANEHRSVAMSVYNQYRGNVARKYNTAYATSAGPMFVDNRVVKVKGEVDKEPEVEKKSRCFTSKYL
jgi:hypothetical protein